MFEGNDEVAASETARTAENTNAHEKPGPRAGIGF
jgi:hypothetical protein